MVNAWARFLITAALAALVLVACSAPEGRRPSEATPSPASTAASPPVQQTSAPTVAVSASATGAPRPAGGAMTASSSAAAAPDPCSLLTVDEISEAYGTPFSAGQRTDTVDSQVTGAKLHECTWKSTSDARGGFIYLYVDVQSNADLSALDKDINTVDGYVHNTSHFIGAKPTQIPGLSSGTALRNGANEIDVLVHNQLLRVSSNTRVLPGLAAAAAARVSGPGVP